jgi:hypothetical protein
VFCLFRRHLESRLDGRRAVDEKSSLTFLYK